MWEITGLSSKLSPSPHPPLSICNPTLTSSCQSSSPKLLRVRSSWDSFKEESWFVFTDSTAQQWAKISTYLPHPLYQITAVWVDWVVQITGYVLAVISTGRDWIWIKLQHSVPKIRSTCWVACWRIVMVIPAAHSLRYINRYALTSQQHRRMVSLHAILLLIMSTIKITTWLYCGAH